ncbi:insulinase family protein [Microbacterium saccharophilum]|uniref:Insulinase family protein n=1 Tax=Microbacterium saccharophilum TaxID=1213358 RepID=A0A5C8I8N0_9MICO|nr:insulinase family protein [Microbacterium saccharophilum]TXK15505.1 insulinase family protein [Microbacterium saccharophilum]GEP47233.1 hypothetical protein MSA03_07410 [Microbacterium saccharophilum]
MPSPAIRVLDVAGLPAYVSDIATTFTGTLVFGVGLRDETARSAGTAHLLEHLIMKRVGKVAVTHNATTSDEVIAFFAQGSPAQVGDFLTRVAAAVSSLHEITADDVLEQRRIISAELGQGDERIGRGNLIDRFGNQSLGLLDFGSPAHRSHTRADALRFADTWLHAGNAALTFTGPIPDGFTLSLPPARPVPERTPPEPIRHEAWIPNGEVPLVLSLVLRSPDAAHTAVARTLLEDALLGRLRTERHLVYSVNGFAFPLGAGATFVGYAMDPRAEDALAAATGAVELLRELAETGPDEAAIREQIEAWDAADDDPLAQAAQLDAIAAGVLRGRRERDDVEAVDLHAVTAADVQRVIADAMTTRFITFAGDTPLPDDDEVTAALGMPPAEDPTPLAVTLSRGDWVRHVMPAEVEVFGGRAFRGLRGASLFVDLERVTFASSAGTMEVRFDSMPVALYSEGQRFWCLVGREGHFMIVDLDQWRGAAKLHDLLGTRIPGDVQAGVDLETPLPA